MGSYVVTEIDKTAWPTGTGIIKAGLHPDKIEEYKNKYGNNWKEILLRNLNHQFLNMKKSSTDR
ncbi:MAG: hypothetical protein CM1200mP28_10740 [Deltaproteobacteria bacterium]|nr:MAG: hypothetical protein CM1200mP28_10740 [Deltaproteobacteria bacterium]